MYKRRGRFYQIVGKKGLRGRGGTFVTSNQIGRQYRNQSWVNPHWLNLARRLDAEVSRSLGKEPPAPPRRYSRPRVRKAPPPEPKLQRIYLVLFTFRREKSERFLKIGVSSLDIRARFVCDRRSYDVSLLAESKKFDAKDAYATEQAIHASFHKSRRLPAVLLNSGNTECYAYTEENVKRFVEIVNAMGS